jgi:hypothetical protein
MRLGVFTWCVAAKKGNLTAGERLPLVSLVGSRIATRFSAQSRPDALVKGKVERERIPTSLPLTGVDDK